MLQYNNSKADCPALEGKSAEYLDTLPKFLLNNARSYPNDITMRKKDLGIWNSYTWKDCFEVVKTFDYLEAIFPGIAVPYTQVFLTHGNVIGVGSGVIKQEFLQGIQVFSAFAFKCRAICLAVIILEH